MELTLKQIAEWTGGRVAPEFADLAITGVTTDSRDAKAGELFVPLAGETFDGHDYICSAMHNCAATLSERQLDPSIPAVYVSDTLRALGDIGRLFPDSDPAYEGADSLLLLREVMKRVTEAGYELVNADCTVIAQAPRLAPYREEMRQKLAEALGVGMSCVGVKATTTEHLGFEGRKEGISARCTVLLQLG